MPLFGECLCPDSKPSSFSFQNARRDAGALRSSAARRLGAESRLFRESALRSHYRAPLRSEDFLIRISGTSCTGADVVKFLLTDGAEIWI